MKKKEQDIKQKQGLEHGKDHGSYCLFTFVSRFYTFMCLLIPLLFLSLNGFSQPGGEIGILGGRAYYLGEYNQEHFKNSQMYIGGLYRYNLNDRFALRFNAAYSKITGSLDSLRGIKEAPKYFNSNVMDFSGVVEFNFRSFMVRKVEKSSWWTPYIFVGLGFIKSKNEGSMSIPIGAGVKFNLYRRFSCGMEWSTRKLFSDMIDQVEDRWNTGETNFMYNKDSFFVAGITLTYRFPMEPVCYY